MIKRLRLTIFAVILFTWGIGQAQDPQFSQFYANPLFLNPALAGFIDCGRVNLNYRNQWPSLANAYITYSASYDQNIPGINSIGQLRQFQNVDQGQAGFNGARHRGP